MATWRTIIRKADDPSDVHYEDDELTADDVAGVKALTAVSNALSAARTAHSDGIVMKIYEKHSETVWDLEDTGIYLPGSIEFYSGTTFTFQGSTTQHTVVSPSTDSEWHLGAIQVGAARAEAPVNNFHIWTDGIEDEDISWTLTAPSANVWLTATTGDLTEAYLIPDPEDELPTTLEELEALEPIKTRKVNVEISGTSLAVGSQNLTNNTVAVNATQVGNYNYAAVAATALTVYFDVVAAG